ncbi:MAG: hypothetical protein ACI8P0_005576 [Planctomycetaceae bacterium]
MLTVAQFDAIPDVVRAGLELDDNNIQRWVEVTIPALVNGTEYTFFPTGTRLRPGSRHWITTIECGDDTPPVLDCTIGETLLWPPNRQLVTVGLELLELSDDQDPAPPTEIFVYSDEGVNDTGDGNTDEDAVDVDFDTLQLLRAERSGNGDGRVYLIVVVATDASGNETIACHTVVVPKSMSKKDRNSVAKQATIAEVLCDDDDALTAIGFSLIGTSIDF